MAMFDLLTACAVIATSVGVALARTVPFRSRIRIGLALLAIAYCAAWFGFALLRAGFDVPLLRYAWAGSFGATAITATIFLVPALQDWLRARRPERTLVR
jgi:hypothetical protein